jgi:hypothetical protein
MRNVTGQALGVAAPLLAALAANALPAAPLALAGGSFWGGVFCGFGIVALAATALPAAGAGPAGWTVWGLGAVATVGGCATA